jgi:hypothetical protein
LAEFLVNVYSAGVVEFHTERHAAAVAVSPRPMASPVARWQVANGRSVTTLHHTSLRVDDELEKTLLALLDGTRDITNLRDEVHGYLDERDLLAEGVPREQSLARVEEALARNLANLATLGLLLEN